MNYKSVHFDRTPDKQKPSQAGACDLNNETTRQNAEPQETDMAHPRTVNDGLVGPTFEVRMRNRHKVPLRVPASSNTGRTNLGPAADTSSLIRGKIDHRTAVHLDKLFRSKSQKARSYLEFLQEDLLGHVIDTPTIYKDTAPYLRTARGLVMVTKKPSFSAVRLLITILSRCERTTYQLPRSFTALP